MNLELFIAKRLIKGSNDKSSVSAPIIKIAIAAIAIGLTMMLITIATGLGLRYKIREKVAAFNGHIQIFNYDNNNSDVSVVPISKNQAFYPQFKDVEGVGHMNVVATKAGIIRNEKTFEAIIAKGVDANYHWQYFEEYLIEGRLPDYTGALNFEVLISEHLANRLELKTGDKFFSFFLKNSSSDFPNQRSFEVVGIYNSGIDEFDSSYIMVDLRHIQRMNKWEADQIGNFELFVKEFDQLPEISNQVYGKILKNLDSESILRKYYSIFQWLQVFDFNIALIISVMLLVGGINMVTALLVLILERTPMIGILKALGASDWSIRKMFLIKATYLIGIGLFWGNMIGLGLLFIQQYFGVITLDPSQYHVAEAPVHMHWDYILMLNIGVLLACVLMLVVASFIITKITPIRAIKFD
ncbi:MAG: FtsX-like permease family protein [Flavobacteriaceae bacterium]|nr:FtsX-like permease family protein [Flavobacteriaceae bacterium]